ncbi:MAG: TolC family protein [Candidatus Gastranaerophilales bacterium]|nr:TolC family protein [Candidatus Gastranaerophilales bacterium]
MKKPISVLLTILLLTNVVLAEPIGNSIIKEEYPDSDLVEPVVESETDSNLTIHGSVQNSIEITLEDCLKFALGNNPKIQAAIQDVFASDARIRQAWSNWFPQVTWQTGYSRIKQLQLSDVFGRNLVFNYYILGQISVSEMLYDFGVTQNQVTIKKLENEQYKIALTSTINEVICDVKNAYYNLLYTFEQKRVAEEMVKRYDLFYQQAKAYYAAGTKPKVDVTIAEVNLSNAKLNLIEAENAVDIAMAKLNNTMGMPYMNKYTVQDKLRYKPCDITLEQAIETARDARPDYKLAEVKIETARQTVKLTKKSWFPQITVEGEYQIGGRTFVSNYGYNFGAYLNFPTVNGMLIRNEIKEARSLHSKEIATAMSTKNDIYLEIQNAFYSLKEKRSKIPVSTLSVKQAKENYELSFGRYKTGVGNPVELKEAQVELRDAELQYYNTLYEYNTARANLEKAIGKNIVGNQITLDLDKKKLKAENKKLKEQQKQALEEDKALRKQDKQTAEADKNIKQQEEQSIEDITAGTETVQQAKETLKDRLKKCFKNNKKELS